MLWLYDDQAMLGEISVHDNSGSSMELGAACDKYDSVHTGCHWSRCSWHHQKVLEG